MTLDKRNFSVNGTGDRPSSFLEREWKASEELASRLEALNKMWIRAELHFRAMLMPLEVVVEYNTCTDSDELPTSATWEMLGLVKHKGSWCICHAFGDSRNPGQREWKPILDCSLEERIGAAAHLGELREAAVKCKEEKVQKVDVALAQLNDVVVPF